MCALAAFPTAASAARCDATNWVGAWASGASDASQGGGPLDLVDPSLTPKVSLNDTTVRAILTPTLGGGTLRVRLSNRFGSAPVTFGRVTVARRSEGAALVAGTVTPLTFGGEASTTVPAGEEILSDAARLRFKAAETLAVDVHVLGDVGLPTEHYTARQTSFLAPPLSGDMTGEPSGGSFPLSTTSRPFVTGVDVLAPAGTGAVVALGDSITDGFQGELFGVPETRAGLDEDGRYPDLLAARLRKAGAPLSLLNAGISGNKVLLDGGEDGGFAAFGPSALNRLEADVLDQTGVTTVIWLEGINDVANSGEPAELCARRDVVAVPTHDPNGAARLAERRYTRPR